MAGRSASARTAAQDAPAKDTGESDLLAEVFTEEAWSAIGDDERLVVFLRRDDPETPWELGSDDVFTSLRDPALREAVDAFLKHEQGCGVYHGHSPCPQIRKLREIVHGLPA